MRVEQTLLQSKHSFRLSLMLVILLIGAFALSSCSQTSEPEPSATLTSLTPTQTPLPPTETPLPTPTTSILTPPIPAWLDPSLPQYIADSISNSPQLSLTSSEETSPVLISGKDGQLAGSWYFLAVAPFYSPLDQVTASDLRSCWSDAEPQNLPFNRILLTEQTLEAMEFLWGPSSEDCVVALAESDLTISLWIETDAVAIIPFENLKPAYKVLDLDGMNPLTDPDTLSQYPLTINLYFQFLPGVELDPSLEIHLSNFDPDRLSVVALTGVTALVRDTANIMESEGVLYPAGDIQNLLRSADITHISNEVPFAVDCPTPDASQVSLTFCSDDSYLALLEAVGTDIVELSGDHFGDWGPEAMLHTIELYQEQGWAIYGGGKNLAEGLAPVFLTDHGNQFAFIGCNGKGIAKYATATADNPGASQCDFSWMTEEISRLSAQGYLVIATMQHEEVDGFWPIALQQYDFRRLADAGAVIVSGSQAHHPQGFEFYQDSFIHYGLGNLFFDQWFLANYNPKAHLNKDKAFIDLHYFYEGRHIGTKLVPLQFIDNARPRPMTADERAPFLDDVYQASRWNGEWIHLYSRGIINQRTTP